MQGYSIGDVQYSEDLTSLLQNVSVVEEEGKTTLSFSRPVSAQGITAIQQTVWDPPIIKKLKGISFSFPTLFLPLFPLPPLPLLSAAAARHVYIDWSSKRSGCNSQGQVFLNYAVGRADKLEIHSLQGQAVVGLLQGSAEATDITSSYLVSGDPPCFLSSARPFKCNMTIHSQQHLLQALVESQIPLAPLPHAFLDKYFALSC